jgi:Ty3 transposon capsid-like protein/zinc knuckle protein
LTPDIAFGRRATTRPATAPNRNNSDRTATDNGDGDNPDDDGDGSGQEGDLPGGPDDDPPDDEGPDDQPNDSDDDVQHNLADTIAALARNVHHQGDGSRSKVREPDPFDGTDPTKLRTFLVQLQLSFNDRPRAFANDRKKVNFAISYLKGIALAHFENSLLEPDLSNPLAWEDDYDEFVSELKTYFGSPDVVGEAESKLENLSMKPTQRIAKYLVEFNRHATITGWDNRALRHQFYRGLPARIKDEVSRVGKPATLTELRTLAQSIDGRYWEREEETRRERGGQSTEKKTEKPHNQTSSSSNQNPQNKSRKKQFTPRDSSSTTQNSDKKTSDLGDKLGKDGKLTLAEQSRRFANNLCLFCGGVGHTARDCPKSSSSAAKAKGRSAKAKSDKPEKTPAEDSKK